MRSKASKHEHGSAPFEARAPRSHLRVRVMGSDGVIGASSWPRILKKIGGLFPSGLQACCNGRERKWVSGLKPFRERSGFGPQSSLWQCHCRRRSRPVSRQSACRGCCTSFRAWVVLPRGLASGSRKVVACRSNHPAGAAHEPGKIGTLSTLALRSGSSRRHMAQYSYTVKADVSP